MQIRKQAKRISEQQFEGSLFSVIKSILANSTADVENEFVKRGDHTRSAYVDDCGLSAVSFTMTEKEKEKLKEAGANAVKEYKERAKKFFLDEKEAYFKCESFF
ncbi:MAG TPA: hypothetical protein PLS50_08420 [Candidatus Dojkabacteria bacterium]|nr:hypothetical protein [Candidatus Dojkabacteria bacterium]